MKFFEKELTKFLASYHLPPLTKDRVDGWSHFLHLYTKVIEDIPLTVSVPKEKKQKGAPVRAPARISHVTVHFEQARETLKHPWGEDVLFRVTWTIHDKNGESGDVFVSNSFERT